MAFDLKKLTINYRDLLKNTSIPDRVNLAKSTSGQELLSTLSPIQLSELFPKFYREKDNSISSLVKATTRNYQARNMNFATSTEQIPVDPKRMNNPVINSVLTKTDTSGSSIKEKTAKEETSKNPSSIGEKIAAGESGGRYDTVYGKAGGATINGALVTESTLGQVLKFQEENKKNNTHAVGKYQFIDVKSLMSKAGLSENDKFDPTNQEKLYEVYRQMNRESMTRQGIPVNDTTEMLSHAIGPAGLKKIIDASKSGRGNANALDVLGLTGKAAKTNPQLNVSADQLIKNYEQKTNVSVMQTNQPQAPSQKQVAQQPPAPVQQQAPPAPAPAPVQQQAPPAPAPVQQQAPPAPAPAPVQQEPAAPAPVQQPNQQAQPQATPQQAASTEIPPVALFGGEFYGDMKHVTAETIKPRETGEDIRLYNDKGPVVDVNSNEKVIIKQNKLEVIPEVKNKTNASIQKTNIEKEQPQQIPPTEIPNAAYGGEFPVSDSNSLTAESIPMVRDSGGNENLQISDSRGPVAKVNSGESIEVTPKTRTDPKRLEQQQAQQKVQIDEQQRQEQAKPSPAVADIKERSKPTTERTEAFKSGFAPTGYINPVVGRYLERNATYSGSMNNSWNKGEVT